MKMVKNKLSLLVVLIVFSVSTGLTIEIPLKPNEFRPQLIIGFVDMQKVFNELSETQQAKKQIDREIEKQKSELDTNKLEITLMESELANQSKKRVEMETKLAELRQKLEKTKEEIETQVKQQQANTPPSQQQEVAVSSSSMNELNISSGSVNISTPAVTIVPSETGSVEIPQYKIEVSTTNYPQLKEVNDKIESLLNQIIDSEKKQKEQEMLLKQKRETLEKQTQNYEETLLKSEDRKTQEILGKIYDTLIILSKEEELDLIMDKNYILFGEKGIDLTQKLLKRLKESQ